ncbi:helix-turn-helix domain-containing protein [Pullulanibacillus sp. KACC 23026]|uniref:helix-turn-helix domain-containing protein n=1 Tax=Pullulanibacillus sp. KACC 23026 TaxID=3028315 RepID=UPI0023B0092E|nr:helix-turn-helix domain-containing protein [Pullulanibacillus sp. KACC 23026]WEG11511.1 helix-turn-helix domain-containing protein [Pullulanibacillus sp. KACC 23026]
MIGKNITKFRTAKGLTLSELAERAKISKSYLSNIERGINKNPSINILEKTAAVLDVDLNLLLSDTQLDSEVLDQEVLGIANELKDMGIEKGTIQEYKALIEFIKWKNEDRENK